MFNDATFREILPPSWGKYLLKRSLIKHTCSLRDKLLVLWTLNRQAKIFLHRHINYNSDSYSFADLVTFAYYYFPKLFHLQFEPKHVHVYKQIPTGDIYLDLSTVCWSTVKLSTVRLLQKVLQLTFNILGVIVFLVAAVLGSVFWISSFLSGLRQYLANESPLKMMKNAFISP